jgi:hypothetical protein
MFNSKLWVLAPAILLGMSLAANATPVTPDCANTTPTAITDDFVCTLGGLTFDFSGISVVPVGTDYLIDPATGVYGNDVVLDIDVVSTDLSSGVDTNLTYSVTSTSANIAGVDNSFGTGTGSIGETVCATPLVFGTSCDSSADTLASFTNTTGALDTVLFAGGPTSSVYIYKDAEGTYSSFTDSIVESAATPEPSSLGLMLAAGLGIVGLARKFRRA